MCLLMSVSQKEEDKQYWSIRMDDIDFQLLKTQGKGESCLAFVHTACRCYGEIIRGKHHIMTVRLWLRV